MAGPPSSRTCLGESHPLWFILPAKCVYISMADKPKQQAEPKSPEQPGSHRDPEERPAATEDQIREKMFDKTLADSFPTSDPPSSIPDPSADESFTKP